MLTGCGVPTQVDHAVTDHPGHPHRWIHAWVGGSNACGGPPQTENHVLHLGLMGSLWQNGLSDSRNSSACFQRATPCDTARLDGCACSYTLVGENCVTPFARRKVEDMTGGALADGEMVRYPWWPQMSPGEKIWGFMGDMQDYLGPIDPAFMPLHAFIDTFYARWQLQAVLRGSYAPDSSFDVEAFATKDQPVGHRWYDLQDFHVPPGSTNIKHRNAAGDLVHPFSGMFGANATTPPRLIDVVPLDRLGYYTPEMEAMCDAHVAAR